MIRKEGIQTRTSRRQARGVSSRNSSREGRYKQKSKRDVRAKMTTSMTREV